MHESDSVIGPAKPLAFGEELVQEMAAFQLDVELIMLRSLGLTVRSSGVDVRKGHAFIDLEPMTVVAAGALQRYAMAHETELTWSFIYQGFDARIEVPKWCQGLTLLITTQTQNFTNVEEARAAAAR